MRPQLSSRRPQEPETQRDEVPPLLLRLRLGARAGGAGPGNAGGDAAWACAGARGRSAAEQRDGRRQRGPMPEDKAEVEAPPAASPLSMAICTGLAALILRIRLLSAPQARQAPVMASAPQPTPATTGERRPMAGPGRTRRSPSWMAASRKPDRPAPSRSALAAEISAGNREGLRPPRLPPPDQPIRSRQSAMPWPPPMQSATRPRRCPARRMPCSRRVVRTAPVAPIG
jgi:hypothetical protein